MRQLRHVTTALLVAALSLSSVSWAENVVKYNLTGSLLSTRGTATVPVTGAIPVRTGAHAYQITGGLKRTVLLPRNQIGQTAGPVTFPIPPAPTYPQLKTDLVFSFPGTPVKNVKLEQGRAKFQAAGRSGPSTISFCPAATQTGRSVFSGVAPYNPACTNTAGPSGTPAGEGFFAGSIKYTRTLNALNNQLGVRFGGRAQQLIWGGGAVLPTTLAPNGTRYGGDVAFYYNTAMTQIGFNLVRAGIDGEHTGQAFGQTNLVSHLRGAVYPFIGPALTPNQLLTPAMIGATEIATVPTGMSLGYGGPFTTGMLNANKPDAAGAPQFYTLSGSDARTAGGEGNLVMVSGAIVGNQVGGGQGRAERGVLTLNFSNAVNLPEPSAAAGALAALFALGVVRKFVRRRTS